MAGINSFEKGKSSNFLREEAFVKKTQDEIAESLGTGRSAIVGMKNHTRGASVQVAKKAAGATGQKPASIFLTTQVAALETRISRKQIKDENVLGAAQTIMRAIKGQFRDSEFDRRDAEFVAAAERLRDIAIAALEMAEPKTMGGTAAANEYMEPTNAVGDSTAVATKSTRDLQGRAVEEGPDILRDGYGRRV
jgi:hypothetical protein